MPRERSSVPDIDPRPGDAASILRSIGPPRTTVLLADESVLVREGVAALCESFGPYQVVAQCVDGEQAFSLIAKLQPDVAILEQSLPRLHVLEVIRRVRLAGLSTRVIVISPRADRKIVLDTLRSGASGYLLKSCLVQELKEALQQVSNGGVYVAPEVGLDQMGGGERRKHPDDPLESLSSREHQVFSLLIEGLRAKEIAARLVLSPKTVDTYRASLMRKLNIHDVAGLVKFAINRKLTSA